MSNSMSMATKAIILSIVLLAGALYYVYSNLQKFKQSVAILLRSMHNKTPQEDTTTEEPREEQTETEPEKED